MTLQRLTCPKCRFPRLEDRRGEAGATFAGEPMRVVDIEYFECPRCHHRVVSDAQARHNQERIDSAKLDALAAKWEVTRPSS